jgi:hypothetical protein
MAMETTLGKKTRLLALAALVAVLPLGIWACEDSGDGPDGPTGPATQYNPQMNYPDATITAKIDGATPVAPGATFGIIATFKDANGLPVEGVPLVIVAEDGGAKGYFTYQTNPTLTDANGSASIRVLVSAGCPEDSYTFMIMPVRGPQTIGYVHVVVSGSGGGGTAIVTGVTLTTSTPSVVGGTPANFVATATATPSCTVRFQYQAAGPGLTITWTDAPSGATNPWLFPLTPAAVTVNSTLTVQVMAYCSETGEGIPSSTVNVTVTP